MRSAKIPWFTAQLGLFLIRHRNMGANFRDARKEGYAYLRHQGEMPRPVFDKTWYVQRYGGIIPAAMSPEQHFIHYGRLLGLDPCPRFNTVFYCLTQSDILHSAYDPVWHFLRCSPFEIRNPSLGFNIPAYLAKHQDVNWPDINPLLHYLEHKTSL